MKMTVVHTIPEEEWRHFVKKHPAGNVFHTPEMFQVFASAKGHHPTLWAVIGGDGQILALLLPVQITLVDGLAHGFTTRAIAYGSVLCDLSPDGQQALALLLRNYTQKVNGGPLFTELRNLSNMEAIQPILKQHGFVYENHLNYLIDLKRPPEAIMQSIGSRTRKNIRRGLRRGEVVADEAKSRDQVGECYDLLRQTYQAARVPLADRSLFEAAFDVLVPKGMARFTLARVGQTPAAISVELLYRGVVYGWYGAVDRTFSSFVPNDLLTWQILRWAAENGYQLYDFGGAGKPEERYGVRDFKAKFGGDLMCYGRNTCVHAPWRFAISRTAYQLLRRALGFRQWIWAAAGRSIR
jgi:serine/alanine adding enzyme